MQKPLAVELFAGLHGWGEGFIAEGYRVVGFDIVDMCATLGVPRPPGAEFVLQDVLTLHGSQFRDAAVIVASPPCQTYSWMAMPWKAAKAKAAWYRESPERINQLNALFDACFRLQREASEAAGRYIPLVVENVKGAQPWVGRAKWHYGSFYLWGDVPALMPFTYSRKNTGGSWFPVSHGVMAAGNNPARNHEDFYKSHGQDWNRFKERGEVSPHWRLVAAGAKGTGGSWFTPPEAGHWKESACITRRFNSKSASRKAASAQIAGGDVRILTDAEVAGEYPLLGIVEELAKSLKTLATKLPERMIKVQQRVALAEQLLAVLTTK